MSLIEISEVEDYVEYLSDNADRIYIDTCVGQRFTEEEDNDEYHKQIRRLGLGMEFNVNELIVFRTPSSSIVLFFVPMYNKLYIVKSQKIILNVLLPLDGYIGFLFHDYLDILNISKMSSSVFEMKDKSYMQIWKNFEDVFYNRGPEQYIHPRHSIDMDIPDFSHSPSENNKSIKYGSKVYKVEKIWSHFCLQKSPCLTTSVMTDNTRSFIHLITINDIVYEQTILEIIEMMSANFFHPITSRILVYDGDIEKN